MKKPISLKELSETVITDDSVVVDMGMIVEEPAWYGRVKIGFFSTLVLLTIGLYSYNMTIPQDITIQVKGEYNPEILSSLVVENGGEVIEQKDNKYKIRLSKWKNKSLFLKKLESKFELDK